MDKSEKKKLYKLEGLRRIKERKAKRLDKFINGGNGSPGSARYERKVSQGLIKTCEWGNARCDLYGCNGDC